MKIKINDFNYSFYNPSKEFINITFFKNGYGIIVEEYIKDNSKLYSIIVLERVYDNEYKLSQNNSICDYGMNDLPEYAANNIYNKIKDLPELESSINGVVDEHIKLLENKIKLAEGETKTMFKHILKQYIKSLNL